MNKFLKNKVLGMPIIYFLSVILILIIGIIVGSCLDFDINVALYNKTDIGDGFATFGSIISYSLYPAAGMCLFKAFKKKGKNYTFLAWVLLILSYFLAVYYSNNYNGKVVRAWFGNFGEEGVPFYASFLSYLFWIVIYSWVPVVCHFVIDDSHPERLIAVGATVLVAGVVSDCMNLWLKQVASRPRYSYLIKEFKDDIVAQRANFRNWWEWNPYFKGGSVDDFKSWPSGNMMIATIACMFPLLMTNIKKSNKIMVYTSFGLSALYVILYGYNRIHMGKHFLTDVCFGVLFTYLIYALVDQGFELAFKKASKNAKKANK